MEMKHIRCGSIVVDVHDPRHHGRVESVKRAGQASVATIRWHVTDWITEDVPLEDLRVVEDDTPIVLEHNFTGTLESWDDRVFQNATEFRVHRFRLTGRHKHEHESFTTDSFARAMVVADDELKAGHRVIVYAIAASGRFVCLPRKQWGHFAELWLSKVSQ